MCSLPPDFATVVAPGDFITMSDLINHPRPAVMFFSTITSSSFLQRFVSLEVLAETDSWSHDPVIASPW